VGGAVSFAFEITQALKPGENELVVYARDDVRSGVQPSGKQSFRPESFGVYYTRVTGIWQTVWLEARLDGHRFVVTPKFVDLRGDCRFRVTLRDAQGQALCSVEAIAQQGIPVVVPVEDPHPWSPQDPYLYGLLLELRCDGRTVDRVESYGGLRKFHIEGNRLYLNNRPIFLRFVLDQGFYPDGIWTAPSDAALKRDIELADWGTGHNFANPEYIINLEREWRDAVLRDRNHPSILAWTPLNETRGAAAQHYDAYSRAVWSLYRTTHALDPTRPLNTTSGYVHVVTDIFTVHDYDQDAQAMRQRYAGVNPQGGTEVFVRYPELSCPYQGQPYVVDEYGGTFWTPEYAGHPELRGTGRSRWGYGRSAREVEAQIEALTRVLLEHPHISGFTYTQLYDVEQEVNGIYTYDRKPKFDIRRLKQIFGAPAAIERR